MSKTDIISAEARQIHERSIVIDLHTDTLFLVFLFGYRIENRHRNPLPTSPFVGHVDLPRLREGGVTSFGTTVPAIPSNWLRREGTVRRSIDKVVSWAAERSNRLAMARNADDILSARERGVPSFFLVLEGAHRVRDNLADIKAYRDAGLLSIILAHLTRCDAAYPNTRSRYQEEPLPKTGHGIIEKMEEVGMIVDLAHMASRCFLDAVAFCRRPPIVSHVGLSTIKPSWRNVSDYEAKKIADKGGVLGVIFFPGFLSNSWIASLDCVMNHIHHLLHLVGDDFVALGSDYDGWVPSMPTDLRDVSYLPRLTDRMLHEGIPVDSIRKILGANALRVIREVCG